MRNLPTAARIAALIALAAAFRTGAGRADDGDLDTSYHEGRFGPDVGVSDVRAAVRDPVLDAIFHVGTIVGSNGSPVSWAAVSEADPEATLCSPDLGIDEFDARAVVRDSGGKLVAGGIARESLAGDVDLAAIFRFDPAPQCGIDADWGSGGFALFAGPHCSAEVDCHVLDLELPVTPAGRLLVLLESEINDLVSDYWVVALNSAGEIVDGFGVDGYAHVAHASFGNLLAGGAFLEADSAGRPLVFFSAVDEAAELDVDSWLARFTIGGVFDGTLNGNGLEEVDTDDDDDTFVEAFAVYDDRAHLAYRGVPTSDDSRLANYTLGFGFPFSVPLAGSHVRALAAQGNGKFLYVAEPSTGDGFRLCRASATNIAPTLDTTFAGDGCAEADPDVGGSTSDTPRTIVLDAGRPVVSGVADSDFGEGLFAIRFENSLIFADGLESADTRYWN